MSALFLSPPSFDGFDGGAGSRYQARREVTSFWYPTWLAQPAALVPGARREDLLAWLAQSNGGEGREPGEARVVIVVGHEPGLGELAAWLVTGTPQGIFPLRKGGACAIRFAEAPAPGAGELRWLLAPGQMRKLAR